MSTTERRKTVNLKMVPFTQQIPPLCILNHLMVVTQKASSNLYHTC